MVKLVFTASPSSNTKTRKSLKAYEKLNLFRRIMKTMKTFFLLLLATIFSNGHASSNTDASSTCSSYKITSPFDANLLDVLQKFNPLTPSPGPLTKYSAVYGSDNRKLMKAEYPWRAIGALVQDDKNICTVTLISSCFALTAAHCVSNRDGTAKAIENISFQASNNGPKSKVKDFLFGQYRKDATDDWAILKLEENLGDQLGFLGVENLMGSQIDATRKHIIAGYNADMGNNGREPTVDDEVQIRFHHKDSTNFIYHNANTYSGSSGSAIFYFNEKNEPWIVGINTRAILNSDGRQFYFKKEPKDHNLLASGVATNQFWDSVLRFMANNPCGNSHPLPPSQGNETTK